MTTPTDTPRPDNCPHCGAFLLTHHTPAYCEKRTARKKAEAEVERLNKQLSITEAELADAREWLDERYKAISEAEERAEKAVERLRTALQSCYWATNTYDGNYTRACDNVATIAINALKTQDK
jgi:predicted  nucleic acid-binding Zn-ribbon protein